MTELDEALQTARTEPTRANYFYDTFLNCPIYVPAQLEGKTEPSWLEIKEDERFKPMFISIEKHKVIPVFDSLEKMKTWSAQRPLDYLLLKAHIFIQLLGQDITVALNPGTAFSYHFPPEILESLRTAMKPIQTN